MAATSNTATRRTRHRASVTRCARRAMSGGIWRCIARAPRTGGSSRPAEGSRYRLNGSGRSITWRGLLVETENPAERRTMVLESGRIDATARSKPLLVIASIRRKRRAREESNVACDRRERRVVLEGRDRRREAVPVHSERTQHPQSNTSIGEAQWSAPPLAPDHGTRRAATYARGSSFIGWEPARYCVGSSLRL